MALETRILALWTQAQPRAGSDATLRDGRRTSYGASATITGGTVSDNFACDLIIYKAGGVSALKNGISYLQSGNIWTGNERDICNYGKGGSSDLQPSA